MATIIHLVKSAPSSLGKELIRAGHQIVEVQTVLELLMALRQHPNPDVILIDSDVREGRERAAALGKLAIILEPDATPNQVLRQLERLFPPSPGRQ